MNQMFSSECFKDLSEACKHDVLYLRTRNRWSQDLEDRLIELHRQGNPPNIFEYGVTKETQQALLNEAKKSFSGKFVDIEW